MPLISSHPIISLYFLWRFRTPSFSFSVVISFSMLSCFLSRSVYLFRFKPRTKAMTAKIKKRKKSILLENTLLPFWVEMLFCFIVSLNIIPQLFLLFPFNQLSILRVKIVPHGFSFICIEIFAVIFITLRLLYKNSVSSSSSKSIGSPSRIAYWYCPVLLSK